MRKLTPFLAAAIVSMSASVVFAHPQGSLHFHVGGFDAGLFHPFLGIDHLLAMVAIGILAARAGGRALWLVPGSFLSAMGVGGLVGMAGWSFWGAEAAIALSVLALGATIAGGRSFPLGLMMAACALFGFFHGHAHGTEMPTIAQPALYAIGFVLATAALHVIGIAIGQLSLRTVSGESRLRFSGAAMAVVGIAPLFWT